MAINFRNSYSTVISITAFFTISISLLVIIGWLTGVPRILSIIPDSATMKFNTALLLFLCGLGLLFTFKEKQVFRLLNSVIAILILAVSFLTFLEYQFGKDFNIDTLLVSDSLSLQYPGRMSPATAICFILTALCLWGIYSKQKTIKLIAQYALHSVTLIALISINSFVLQIPMENRIAFLNTMAIHTSALFFLLSIALSLKNNTLGITGLLTGYLEGSKIFRFLLPFIIIVPLLLSYALLWVTNENWVEKDFGIAIYTVTLMLLCFLYIALVSTHLNRTDEIRNRLEESLKSANAELLYFKKGLDASFIVSSSDENDIIHYVNSNFCEISKYEESELIGKSHNIINSEHHPKSFFKNLWKTVSSGKIWVGDIKNTAKNGTDYWEHTTIVPFKDETGKIYQYLSIRQDITKRKKAEAMLRQYVRKIEQKNQELEEYNFITSHDLQEPLRTISSFVDVLEIEYKDTLDEQADTYFQFIKEATDRMRDQITGLLQYSRIGGERKLEMVDCNEIVKFVQQDLSIFIRETATVLTVEDLPKVQGYKIELRLLFQNLINNAIKFHREGVDPVVHIKAVEENGFYKFSISDNGIGIADKNFNKIFVIFQRLHNRDDIEGTGIGLAHCRKIVHLHGGEIWAESKINEGSTFYFTIPIS